MRSITELVSATGDDDEAINKLIVIAYERLHLSAKLALGYSGNQHSIQATELVNELFLYFKGKEQLECENSAHFFAMAALKLRHLLADRIRRKSADKRNHGIRVDNDEAEAEPQLNPPSSILESILLNQHIEQLEKKDPLTARIVELLVFWEFSHREVAEILGIGERTVNRRWNLAKAWLSHRVKS